MKGTSEKALHRIHHLLSESLFLTMEAVASPELSPADKKVFRDHALGRIERARDLVSDTETEISGELEILIERLSLALSRFLKENQ